jgi:serine/threonine protein kinase
VGARLAMGMSSSRWNTITPSQFPWEQEALDFIRQSLPDHDPYRAWSNFEFTAPDGSLNEVDLLVFAPQGLFLIEIKSHPGILTGDTHTWTWRDNGRTTVVDNPLRLADKKAKRLAALLKSQRVFEKVQVPYIEPLIFCSAENLQCQLQGNARFHVALRDAANRAGILAAIRRRDCPGLSEQPRGVFDRPMAKTLTRALEQAGVRPSRRSRRVGDYELEGMLDEGPGYQDFLGRHVALTDTFRRIRIYQVQRETNEDQRTTLRRAAEREYQLLQTLEHRGVLAARDFTEHELGPAILFQHHPNAVRLDHYLAQRKDQITDDLRLGLMRQIAETIRFAHEKHVVHRALSPSAILVVNPESSSPQTVITNWQLGYRQSPDGQAPLSREVTATIHVDRLTEEASRLFMAPEAFVGPDELGEHQDIFSLGAICYQLFTGRLPAEDSLALGEVLRTQGGLRVSAVLNGAPEALDLLVQYSTDPNVENRLDTADDFLEYLDKVEDELTTPSNQLVGDPNNARPGDVLPGGYHVLRKLGTGSTATAFLVQKDDREFVVKVAVDVDHNERVRDEGEVLQKLDSSLFVHCYGVTQIADRTAILLERAGEKTLGQRLRQEGRLNLDLLERFGEDLLQSVVILEREGIAHRDIKPDNIGVALTGSDSALHLVLFDFSLSRCSPENIRAGTPGYLDPFLPTRKRWDLQAERFAAAVTLYQMATGVMPSWSKGSDPALVDAEVTLDAERFDANLRDEFSRFFGRALRRKARERFDNAQQMLDAWQAIFRTSTVTGTITSEGTEADNAALLASATLDTNVAELGLGAAAVDALDRINVVKVRDLLRVWGRKLARMRGVGNRTRKRILAAVKVLRARLGTATPAEAAPTPTEEFYTYDSQIPLDKLALDLLQQRILKAKAKSRSATENTALEALLGHDDRIDEPWPSQGDVAPLVGVTRGRISQILSEALKRWQKDPAITAVRDQILGLLDSNGGVMSAEELAETLLTMRGSEKEGPARTRVARVVTRAAVETENSRELPRYVQRRFSSNALMATDITLADYGVALGRKADEIAKADPLVPPARVIEMLREVPLPPEAEPLSDTRLVRLAAAASESASVSSRQELYPWNMEASRAIKLSQGALVGARVLTIDQIAQRVRSRYPQASALPGHPELDKLLIEAGLELVWNPDHPGGGAYVSTARNVLSITDVSSTPSRYSTVVRATPTPSFRLPPVSPEVAEARQFADRLRYAEKNGAFLALTVKQNLYEPVRDVLLRHFNLRGLDLESVFLSALRQAADAVGADWDVVVSADAAERNSTDWRNLNHLIAAHVIPKVEELILNPEVDAGNGKNEERRTKNQEQSTVLLYHLNWLQRYAQVVLLARVQQAVQDGRLHGAWLLIPASPQTEMPLLDGQAVPVITNNQWAQVPESWWQNLHCGKNEERRTKKE